MAHIALFGPTGMLGNAIYDVLRKKHQLTLIYRDEAKLSLLEKAYGDLTPHRRIKFDVSDLWEESRSGFEKISRAPVLTKICEEIGDVDLVVNGVGVIKPYAKVDPALTLFVNGALPHLLSSVFGEKLVQITTDCIYSGIDGSAPYRESSVASPNDLYGLSKSIGEPSDRSLVLRTSIIGPELHGFVSLLSWVKKQEGQKTRGFTRHLWNGITTKQFGKIVDQVAENRSKFPARGLFHVFSNVVTKYEMVCAIAEKCGVKAVIEQDDGPQLDRTLASDHKLSEALSIPPFVEMLREM